MGFSKQKTLLIIEKCFTVSTRHGAVLISGTIDAALIRGRNSYRGGPLEKPCHFLNKTNKFLNKFQKRKIDACWPCYDGIVTLDEKFSGNKYRKYK